MNLNNKDLVASESIKKYLKIFESLRFKAYLCPAGVWTIGFGTTILPSGNKVLAGMTCTKDEAEFYFNYDVKKFSKTVYGLVDTILNQNQFDALISLVYNIGHGNFSTSTVLKRLNYKNYLGAAEAFMMWNKYKKNGILVYSKGLNSRRLKEKEIFLTTPKENEKLITMIDNLKARTYAYWYRKDNIFNSDIGSLII